ncbi:MAG: HDIG domain-containing protein [Firmicutes bacterium]|nr:HDIG domain-containing protein [Bacillota bacterium]
MKKNSFKNVVIIYFLLFASLATATILKFVLIPDTGLTTISSLIFQLIAILLIICIFALFFLKKRNGKYILTIPINQLAVISTCIAITYIISIYLYLITPLLMPVFLTSFLLVPLVKRQTVLLANLFCNILIFTNQIIRQISYAVYLGDFAGFANIPFAATFMFLIGILSGSVSAFVLTYESRRFDFMLKAAVICLFSIGIAVAISSIVFVQSENHFVMVFANTSPFNLGEMAMAALVFSSAAFFSQLILTIILQPVFEKLFNLLTNARLIDLTDHNFPLMKRLINETPGTFNHALTVANFAEVCATAIGENPYLARAMAYYHDIGKLENPQFFKENQQEINPHDSILPEVSAEIIKNHAEHGYKLCKKYRIPNEIALVTIEHHGTLPITVFLVKAQNLTDGKVDIKEYSYSGPTPSTKMAAIIMICDTAEAAIRAASTDDMTKKEEIIYKLIQDRIALGQFDNCDITLKELYIIKDTILSAFSGVHHKRIKYPDGK